MKCLEAKIEAYLDDTDLIDFHNESREHGGVKDYSVNKIPKRVSIEVNFNDGRSVTYSYYNN